MTVTLRETVDFYVKAGKLDYAPNVPLRDLIALLDELDARPVVNPGNPDPPLPEDYPTPGLAAPAERQPGEPWTTKHERRTPPGPITLVVSEPTFAGIDAKGGRRDWESRDERRRDHVSGWEIIGILLYGYLAFALGTCAP